MSDSTILQRIQQLEDIEAIKKLKARYFHACDQKQLEVMRECFVAESCLIDYGAVGVFDHRDALVELFREQACHDHIIDTHHGQNPQISIISDTVAVACWDLFFFQINTKRNRLTQLSGFYQDQFVKTDGVWQIQATTFKATSTLISDLQDGVAKVVAAMNPQLLPVA